MIPTPPIDPPGVGIPGAPIAPIATAAPANPLEAAPASHPSLLSRIGSVGQFVAALGLTLAALAYLILHPGARREVETGAQPPAETEVRLIASRMIHVAPASPLGRKLESGASLVHPIRIATPVLTVTGTVVASLRPGKKKGKDYWQFNAPEVLTAYTDWRKASADITFARTQLEAVKELSVARQNAQQKVVARLEKLVKAGTDTEKDLAAAKADLLQARIQGRKDVHEAETAVRVAERNEAALARQLQQAGLDPSLLTSMTSDVDIVMADVPETAIGRVRVGQGCEARFFGLPAQVFSGKVNNVAPVISRERRSLRVLFTIADLKDQLRPGMFADIGLGTDARNALLVPAEGVVHVGRADYLLVSGREAGTWRVIEVEIGESHGGLVEVLKGIAAGERVVGAGAVLLKPLIVRAVQPIGNGAGGSK